jgi:head-tail adaptor
MAWRATTTVGEINDTGTFGAKICGWSETESMRGSTGELIETNESLIRLLIAGNKGVANCMRMDFSERSPIERLRILVLGCRVVAAAKNRSNRILDALACAQQSSASVSEEICD